MNESTIGADASVHACVHLWIANSIQFTCFHIEKKPILGGKIIGNNLT